MGFLDNTGLTYVLNKIMPLIKSKQEQLTFDSTPTAGSSNPVTSDGVKAAIDASNNTFIVEFVSTLSASGVSLSLPQDVTYETVKSAVDNNMHVIGIVKIPSAAGDLAGVYSVPFTRNISSGSLGFSTTGKDLLMYAWILTDSSVSFGYYNIERQSNKVTELSASVTNDQYPSAKAAYDFVIAQTGGLTFKVANTVPTVDDRSVITFVVEG